VSLSYLFRMGRTTVASVVLEVCEALVSVLKDDFLKVRRYVLQTEICT